MSGKITVQTVKKSVFIIFKINIIKKYYYQQLGGGFSVE